MCMHVDNIVILICWSGDEAVDYEADLAVNL